MGLKRKDKKMNKWLSNNLGDNYPFIPKQEFYTKEESIEFLTKAKMYDYIKKCVKDNGLEYTEDIIKRVYNTAPKLKEQMLEVLHEIWKG